MEFYRSREKNDYIKYENSFLHNTALLASENEKVFGVFEYDIKNIYEAEIVNLNILEECDKVQLFKGFVEELVYWNPYVKTISYGKDENIFSCDELIQAGFKKDITWILDLDTNVNVFKIDINDIVLEQLTVDKAKLDRACSWIEKPEDVVVTCVKIDNKIVSIDGHSRLVAAFNKGFKYVYVHFEPENTDTTFYRVCMSWCEEAGVFGVSDLTKRVVTPEEHERLWYNRCQDYLKKHAN